jgi:hypothetical protein
MGMQNNDRIDRHGTLAETNLDYDLYVSRCLYPVSAVMPVGLRLGSGLDFLAS